MFWENVATSVISGLFAVLAAYIAASFALSHYFRQKEYEIVKQRYLENGIDKIVSGLEINFNNLRHNWARSLFLVQQFRDYGEHFDITELDKGFLEIYPADFERVANHRIEYLTKSEVIWLAFQLSLVFAKKSNDVITKELPKVMEIKNDIEEEEERRAVAVSMYGELTKINDNIEKYELVIDKLMVISSALEREKLGFDNISRFSRLYVVREALEYIEKEFKEVPGQEKT